MFYPYLLEQHIIPYENYMYCIPSTNIEVFSSKSSLDKSLESKICTST